MFLNQRFYSKRNKRVNTELPYIIETPLRETIVVDTVSKCENAVQQIIADCGEIKAVGFDCEWIGQRILSKVGKVLILTICSPKGYCALFRLNKFHQLPKCLTDFLEDKVYKKAAQELNFALTHLWADYQIKVNGAFCLRKYAMNKEVLEERLGDRLQHIAQHLYNVWVHRDLTDFDMTKFVEIELEPESIEFAAADAHVFIEIYKHFFPSA